MPQSKRKPHRLRATDETAEFIRGLHPQLKRKVRAALRAITTDPAAGKSLRDELQGLKSFRVGRLRVIYRIASRRTIEVVAIGPRRTIYEETYRLLRKACP